MIHYDKHQWSSHLFDIEGTMVREITGRVLLCVAWTVVIVVPYKLGYKLGVSATTHTLVGVAMGLLLVFRTNASYDRYWEGRKEWGSIVNASRNLAREARIHLQPAAPDLAARVVAWTTAFAYATMDTLRENEGIGIGLGPISDRLPKQEVEAVLASSHIPVAVLARLSAPIVEARDRGVVSEFVMVALDRNVGRLVDHLGACERIHKTPLPFVYVVHLRRALILYCFTLPFAIVEFYGWGTILVTLFTSYTFFGIEEIGVEIENPFGDDANDLPLEQFCETVERDTTALLAANDSEPGRQPA